MAAANEMFDSWLSSTNLQEYAERLKQNGFDDIDLLKQMDHEEIEEMILLIGMEKKGHILKLKKCLMGLKAPLKQPGPPAASASEDRGKIKQTVIGFSKEGKLFLQPSTVDEKPAWEKYLYPSPKTDRLLFFNSVTAEIYSAAHSSKQTQFKSYLDGQRRFRWDVMQDIKRLDEIIHLYDQGVIPKENIKLDRYVNVPEDPSIKDVNHANRALRHVMSTHAKIDKLLDNLKQRNLQLYDKEEMQLKRWASNESNVIQGFLSSLNDLQAKVIAYENNLNYVVKILRKRFDQTSVKDFDIARKQRRRREQKSKDKKKKRVTLVRNVRMFLAGKNLSWDEIDKICPNSYGKKGSCTVTKKRLGKEDKDCVNIMSYLKMIGGLAYDSDDDIPAANMDEMDSMSEDVSLSDSSDNN